MNDQALSLLAEAINKINEAVSLLKAKESEKLEEKKLSLDEVRTELTTYARKGYTKDIRDIIVGYGATKLSELKPEHYEEVLERMRGIINAK